MADTPTPEDGIPVEALDSVLKGLKILDRVRASVDYCAGRAPYGSSELAENWRVTEYLLATLAAQEAEIERLRETVLITRRLLKYGEAHDYRTNTWRKAVADLNTSLAALAPEEKP